MRRPLLTLAAAVLIAAPSPTAAQATGDTSIGFDDIAQDGVSVTNQYASLGVTFGSTSGFGVDLPGNGCGPPVTGSNPQDYDGEGRWIQPPRCGAAEFEYSGSTLSFSWPHQSVSVWALAVPGYAPTIRMTGYNSALDQVATTSQTLSDTYWTHVTLSTSGPAMSWLVIDTDQAGPVAEFVLDDLSYDAAASPISVSGAFSATTGSPFSGVVAHLIDGDTTAVASDYTATIDWGDGRSSAGSVVAAAGGGFDITGTHTYGTTAAAHDVRIHRAGDTQYTVHVSVTKTPGRVVDGTSTAFVAPAGSDQGPPPVARFTFVPDPPCQAEPIEFDASASTSGQPIVSYRWSFAFEYHFGSLTIEHYSGPFVSAGPTYLTAFSGNLEDVMGNEFDGAGVIRLRPVLATLTIVDAAGRTTSTQRKITYIDSDIYVHWQIIGGNDVGDNCPRRTRSSLSLAPPSFAINSAITTTPDARAANVALSCPAGSEQCFGLLALVRPSLRQGGMARAAGAVRAKLAVLGSSAFTLRPGQHQAIRVVLNRAARRLVLSGRLTRVELRLETLGPGGRAIIRTRIVQLRRGR
jgi:hypothetical protein